MHWTRMSKDLSAAADAAASNRFRVDASRFAFTPRRLRVVCIGAGFSGLTLAYKLQHERSLDYVDWVVYEKNPEVGGAWWENVYPGVCW